MLERLPTDMRHGPLATRLEGRNLCGVGHPHQVADGQQTLDRWKWREGVLCARRLGLANAELAEGSAHLPMLGGM